MKEDNIKATVFIPTYNGQTYLDDIITAVQNQRVDFDFELLIIDSGSSDATLQIIEDRQKTFSNLRLHKIPNAEFGHGKTRNLAAQMSKGEFIVYLSHDAMPSHDRWLYEMVKPFELDEKIVAVMGKQIPRHHCIPMLKYEIIGVFNNFGPDFGTTIFYKDDFIKDQATYDAARFYSDVNSATRRRFLLETIPYRDVAYAEDQMFGEDVLDAGYTKVYAARGSVIHSNDFLLKEYKRRMFDEVMGLRKNGAVLPVPSLVADIKAAGINIVKDELRILRDPSYTWKRRLYWLALNPLFRIEKQRGVHAALRIPLNDEQAHRKHSLEHNRKK